jgi:alkyl sulfatase BDS1-like metallo-beta-lactamase superfamily hydrolase
VKAVYQRYLGWFDGNPAHLWPHPPAESSARYVDCMGGSDVVVARAEAYASNGDLRFAAELLDRVVFADPDHGAAKEILAGVYERLAYGAENGTWRNFYLMGAHELRHGIDASTVTVGSASLISALTVEQLLDAIAIRIDGPKAWDERLAIDWHFTDLEQTHRASLGNGVLTHRIVGDGAVGEASTIQGAPSADLTLTLTRTQMVDVLFGGGLDGISTEGDIGVITRLLAVVEFPDRNFPVVTP